MTKTKLIGSAGRFGVRYGQSARRKTAAIEEKQRKTQLCIFCSGKAKRISKGIWLCGRCGKKFAAHAYFLEKTTPEAFVKNNKEKTKALKDKK